MAVAYNPSIVTDGLIFYLDAANIRSYSGSGTNVSNLITPSLSGTLTNGVGYNSNNNGILVFDGTNDYLDFASYTPDTNTVNIWIKFNTLQNGPIVYVGNDNYGSSVWSWSFFIYNGAFYFRANPGNFADFTEVPPINVWINYTLIRNDGSGVSLAYKNGTYFGSSSNSALSNPYPFLRVAKAGSAYASFNMSLVQIYNRALSATEILQNYNATKGRYL
jgi:hypothetical protein